MGRAPTLRAGRARFTPPPRRPILTGHLPPASMTAVLAVEFTPEAAAPALHALRQDRLAIEALDLWRGDAICTVRAEDEAPLRAALDALARCPGVHVAYVAGEG